MEEDNLEKDNTIEKNNKLSASILQKGINSEIQNSPKTSSKKNYDDRPKLKFPSVVERESEFRSRTGSGRRSRIDDKSPSPKFPVLDNRASEFERESEFRSRTGSGRRSRIDNKSPTPKFPVLDNRASEFDFRPRSSSARLMPRKLMKSISEDENQPSTTSANAATPPISERRKSSLIKEMENINEIMSSLQHRRKSLQTILGEPNANKFVHSKKRRSSSHVPTITYQMASSPTREVHVPYSRRSSQVSTANSESLDFSPEMLAHLHGKRRRSMQKLISYYPSEAPLMASKPGFRERAASLFVPRRLNTKTLDEYLSDLRNIGNRRRSLQNSGGVLDNSLERVFDLKNRSRKSSQVPGLEDIKEHTVLYKMKNYDDINRSKEVLDIERNYQEDYREDDREQNLSRTPEKYEIKIIKVNVDETNDGGRAETPLIPPSEDKFLIPTQQINTTNNNNNNNNNLIPNHHRKSIPNLSVRRRSSISYQEGSGTTFIQNTTYTTPDNKYYEETLETFHIVDEESNSSISSNTNINNNKMAPKIDAVSRITGEWGKWQLRTVLLIFLCKIPSSWFMACIIFTAPAPRHGEFYCKPPETIGSTNHTKWIKISHPEKEEADDQEFNIDFCNVYQDAKAHAHEYFHYDSETLEPKPWEKPEKSSSVIPCNSFEHKADYHSLITQFDLVCSRDILVATTQFFHLFGVLTGGILATHLLKHFSPKNVMLFGMLTQIFCGNMTGHVVSYELHVFFRCLSAVCCAQMYTAGAMIFNDITGGKYRTSCVCLFEQFWSIGVILLPVVSSFFKSWTHIYMAISFPTIILVYLWKWIPDSPRWLLQRGRLHEAREILIQCIEINGTQDSLPLDIDHQLKQQSIDLINAPEPAGWWTIWKGERAILHIICVHLAWSIYIVIYYGMLLNIRAFSREHLEINTVIAGCSEIIGTFIGLYLILNTSVKWQVTGIFNIIAGFIAYLAWIIPQEIKGNQRVALLMVSAMISKAAISCTLSILTTCTTELVSDEKKKICAYSTIVWARIWLLTAPFVGATIVFGQLIPQTCFASLAIIGGMLTTCINSPRTIPKPSSSSSQMKVPNSKLNSNLPPELMPGIWTIKHHDEKYRI